MCSTIVFGNRPRKLLAHNYDYSRAHALVATNLRGTEKENGRQRGELAKRWSVLYGSVTFNSFALELPASGINEAGLCVALMWHDGGDLGRGGPRPRMDPLQWIQYQLDNFGSVQEVLKGLDEVRPRQEKLALHFVVLDAKGDTLVLEFLNGEPVVALNPNPPVLTNSSYDYCVEAAKEYRLDASTRATSLGRFTALQRIFASHGQEADVDESFFALSTVEQRSFGGRHRPLLSVSTIWSTVFDPRNRCVHLRTLHQPETRTLYLDKLSLGPSGEYLLMDIDAGQEGEGEEHLEPYTQGRHELLFSSSASHYGIPKPEEDRLLKLVDQTYSSRRMPPAFR